MQSDNNRMTNVFKIVKLLLRSRQRAFDSALWQLLKFVVVLLHWTALHWKAFLLFCPSLHV